MPIVSSILEGNKAKLIAMNAHNFIKARGNIGMIDWSKNTKAVVP